MTINTEWDTRQRPQNDKGFINTQFGILAFGNKCIKFHTGIFSEQNTSWKGRD